MLARGKRRGYARTRISRMETAISCMLLLLLAGVAVAIYAKGRIYDPGLYRPELTALSKQAPIEARSVEPRTDQPASAGAQMPSPDAGRQAPSLSSPLDGLAPRDGSPWRTSRTSPPIPSTKKSMAALRNTLIINSWGLTCVSLVNARDSKQFIDVYLYDMGQPAQAFGVFSVERTEGLPAVPLGREGYRAEASYFFWKGRYYVQVLASGKGTLLRRSVSTLPVRWRNG